VVVAGKGVGVEVTPDDQAALVDAACKRTAGAEGIVERRVGAVVGIEDIAVVATVLVTIPPDDLVQIVDAACIDVADVGRRTVEDCGAVHGHNRLHFVIAFGSERRSAGSQSSPLVLIGIPRAAGEQKVGRCSGRRSSVKIRGYVEPQSGCGTMRM
jgi:hypothetical protein